MIFVNHFDHDNFQTHNQVPTAPIFTLEFITKCEQKWIKRRGKQGELVTQSQPSVLQEKLMKTDQCHE